MSVLRHTLGALASAFLTLSITVAGPVDSSLDPAALIKEIGAKGAKPVVDELKGQEWPLVIKGIETGAKPWLRVAVALHPATDGGLAESLVLAAGVALARAPGDVLVISGRELSIEGVCGYPDMTDPRTDSQTKVQAYLDARIEGVKALSDANLAALQTRCLSELNKTRLEVARPDGPFSR